MILSASRRTDIPGRYSPWFLNRLRAGFVLTRNPMNHAQLSRIPLTPEIVDCIVFWTKDPQDMLPRLGEIDRLGYRYIFQFTLTPYGRELEPNLRRKAAIEETFIGLSKQIGRERVLWRYDPIILNENLTLEYHQKQFRRLCQKLSPYTESVTISFVDVYAKLKTPLVREITAGEMEELAGFIGETAKEFGLRATACCEKIGLTAFGIQRASCIDRNLLERVCGCPLDLSRDKNQREGCGCMESIDIGAYSSCPNGCVYCYANDSAAAVVRRAATHDPESPLLIGTVGENETVKERKVYAHRREQTVIEDYPR